MARDEAHARSGKIAATTLARQTRWWWLCPWMIDLAVMAKQILRDTDVEVIRPQWDNLATAALAAMPALVLANPLLAGATTNTNATGFGHSRNGTKLESA
jgi:hypothetical protein